MNKFLIVFLLLCFFKCNDKVTNDSLNTKKYPDTLIYKCTEGIYLKKSHDMLLDSGLVDSTIYLNLFSYVNIRDTLIFLSDSEALINDYGYPLDSVDYYKFNVIKKGDTIYFNVEGYFYNGEYYEDFEDSPVFNYIFLKDGLYLKSLEFACCNYQFPLTLCSYGYGIYSQEKLPLEESDSVEIWMIENIYK